MRLLLVSIAFSVFLLPDADKSFALGVTDSIDVKSNTELKSDSIVYAVKKMKIYNSKKPSKKEIENTVSKIWLLRIFLYKGVQARPVIDIALDGKEQHLEFEPVRSFESESEAFRYAEMNDIKKVILLE